MWLAACIFNPSYEGTEYACENGKCPSGFECVAEQCLPLGRDAAAGHDAKADASADATGDATMKPDAAECDPTQQPHNDACSQAILLVSGQTTCGDTSDHTDVFDAFLTCISSPTIGPDAVYEIAADPGQEITVLMTPDGWDGEVYLVDDCTSFTNCLAGSEGVGTGLEEFSYTAKSGDDGTDYFIIVDGATAVQYGVFTLSVTVE